MHSIDMAAFDMGLILSLAWFQTSRHSLVKSA